MNGKDSKRCLMVACGSMCRVTGYSVRVWTALSAVGRVQAGDVARPVLLTFESLRDWRKRTMLRELRQAAAERDVELIVAPMVPKKLPGSVWLNRLWCASVIRYQIRRRDIGVVHSQGHVASGAAARALRTRPQQFVFDVHGVDVDEALNDGRLTAGTPVHRVREKMEVEALQRADWLLVVSSALGAHVRARAAEHAKQRLVPCVNSLPALAEEPEQLRRAARQRLHIGDDQRVVLYLGGASDWQQPALLVKSLRHLVSLHESVVFLIVTGDVSQFQQLVDQAGISQSRYRICSVPHAEVTSVATAADVGLLLREDNLINRVASPTKFGEYLALGIPVAVTDALRDFAQIVEGEGVGVVIPAASSAEQVGQALGRYLDAIPEDGVPLRRRCRDVCQQYLSFDSILPVYREIYGRPQDGPGIAEEGK